jgi:hypothetical protein
VSARPGETTNAADGLTKIRVELPNHPNVGGESMWALTVGEDVYELRNVPFHAYDLNFLDVVEARAEGPEMRPTVRRVVRRSGHQTLRCCFNESALQEERLPLMMGLRALGATFEGASGSYFAIDVEPGGDYLAVREQLRAWEEQGLLSYETCEARVPGSFDDRPPAAPPSPK